MKKILLSLTVIASAFASQAQVVVAGVSPAAVQGNYEFTTQAACGSWPGETDDGTWGVITNLDFNVPGTFILDTLMLVEDGTPGLNPQGNPISQEGCSPLNNDLTGKIAVIYRNTCSFVAKLQNAQNAGAIAAIIVNREDALLGMLGDAVDGINVTIPAVFVSNVDGDAIIAEMSNGPVTMFIGNKIGAFNDDLGAVKGEFLVSPYGGNNSNLFDGFEIGIQAYNYGINDQLNTTINASIDGPNGNVYDETIAVPLNSGDTLFAFPGNSDEFPAFNLGGVGNYDNGDYTLTYTVSTGGADDFPYDNIYTADFKIQDNQVSLSRLDGSDMPIATNYPTNSTTEYQSCMMFQEPNASALAVEGMYFVPHTDTSVNELAGAEIFANAYQWDDGWVDLNDAAYTFDPATNDAFQNLNLVTFGTHYPTSNDDVDDVAYVAFSTPFQFIDNQRYLFCLQTFESATISFGYDNTIDYGANYSIFAQPVSPVHVDGSWYAAGWNGSSASSMALKTFDPAQIGLGEVDVVEGSAFPNPATDKVTVSIDANGDAALRVVDVAGKLAMVNTITLVNGSANVDMSSLDAGVYIFNVTLENGRASQFSVVKK